MKTRIRAKSIALLAAIPLSGCAVVVSPVGNAAVYTGVQGPVAVGAAAAASKTGRSCAKNYVGVVALGDASISAAKQNGGITSVATVDHESMNVLGVFSQFCTVVRGE